MSTTAQREQARQRVAEFHGTAVAQETEWRLERVGSTIVVEDLGFAAWLRTQSSHNLTAEGKG